jgi:signal transduction histidine kinase
VSAISPWDDQTDRWGNFLFLALVGVSYLAAFILQFGTFTLWEATLLVVLGVVYTVVGIYGGTYAERSPHLFVRALYFCVEIPLGGVIVYLSDSWAWMILLPLLGQAVYNLPGIWVWVCCALNYATMGLSTGLLIYDTFGPGGERLYPLSSAEFWYPFMQGMMQYLIAVVFVILFTLIAVREHEARDKVEQLAVELQEANRQLRAYAAQAGELAALKERNRMAREIHDGLGHYLTAINMQIEAGRAVLERDRALGLDAISKAQGLAQEGLSEVRRSVATLRTSPLENRPLSEAVRDLVDECQAAGLDVRYEVRGEARPLTPQSDLALYRAAQEGLTNLRKHAGASRAEVCLDFGDPSAVCLAVRDDGVGAADTDSGFGLVGIRERVHLLGGVLRIETAPGEGFVLEVEVPG